MQTVRAPVHQAWSPTSEPALTPRLEEISFSRVHVRSGPYAKLVRFLFKTCITSIYGDQTSALAKLVEGQDRSCELMFYRGQPTGIIVYKNILQNEYGLDHAFELKTLCLLDPESDSGKGLGSCLWHRVDEIAHEMNARVIYCTASSKVGDSIKCALKNGYSISKLVKNNEEERTYLLTKEGEISSP